MADGRNLLTGYDASEGALYVLLMLVLTIHPKAPRLLAIDNADHGLNPRLARRLMSHVCEWMLSTPDDKQLLLTTHNPLVLDGLPLDNDEVRLFAVDRSRRGRTVVERVKVDVKSLFRDGETWTRLQALGEWAFGRDAEWLGSASSARGPPTMWSSRRFSTRFLKITSSLQFSLQGDSWEGTLGHLAVGGGESKGGASRTHWEPGLRIFKVESICWSSRSMPTSPRKPRSFGPGHAPRPRVTGGV